MVRSLCTAVMFALTACGQAELYVHEEPYVDHDLGQLTAGLNVGAAGGCDTSIVKGLTLQLVEELNCIAPNTMVDFSGSGVTLAGSVQPYLAPAAATKLKAAVAAAGTTISVNSAYRSVAQQALLYRWWKEGRCSIQIAAVPGNSNHQSGRAIDVNNYSFWISKLSPYGWQWYGSGDLVHFDFNAAPDLGGKSVLAFQRLWNKNKPNKLSEDGDWGPATESAMGQSPAEGFAVHGCGQVMEQPTGTLTGRIYRLNPDNPGDLSNAIADASVSVGGLTLMSDATGQYTAQLPAGTYTITAVAPGFAQASLSRQVTAGQTIWGSIGLAPTGAADTTPPDIAVTDVADGDSFDLAAISLEGTASDNSGLPVRLTVAMGEAAPVEVAVEQGAFSAQLTLRPGSNVVELGATDQAGNRSTVRLALKFRAGLEGRVIAADSQSPVAGAAVALLDPSGVSLSTTVADADGHFAFDELAVPLTGALEVSAEGFKTERRDVEVTDRERAVVEVMLSQGAEVPIDRTVYGGCSTTPSAAPLLLLVALTRALRRRVRA